MDKACETCRFWKPATSGGAFFGDCRRGLPVIRFETTRDGDETHPGYWPVTSALEWCGEYQPRPETKGGSANLPTLPG